MNDKGKIAIAAFVFLALAAFYHFGYPGINDGDTFYHFRHAAIYREQGIFTTEFPWVNGSVVSKYASDIWYGFHVFLIPFTLFGDEILGMKIAGAVLTIAVLLMCFFALKLLRARHPALWTLLILFSTADMNYRLTMVRPHLLTFGLAMLIFFFAVNRRALPVLVLSALVSFFHLSLAWLSVLIALATAFAGLFDRSLFGSKSVEAAPQERPSVFKLFMSTAAAAAGSVIGLLLRPNPLGALKLAYVQVVRIIIEKSNGIPIRFGTELKPTDLSIFVHQLSNVLVLFAVAAILIVIVMRRKKFTEFSGQARAAILASFGLSIFFELLTNFVARRSMDLWIGFSVIFIALVWTRFSEEKDIKLKNYLNAGYMIAAIALLFMLVNTLYYSSLYRSKAFSPERFKAGSEWLALNAVPGEIVFNLHWDDFPFLFFHNRKNYYISGMDPIFEYAFDKNLYWGHYFLDIDKIYLSEGEGYSCPEFQCTAETTIPINTMLKEKFGASYVFILPARNPKVFEFLADSPKFKKVFESGSGETIFKVL